MDLKAGKPEPNARKTAALAVEPLIFGLECRDEPFDGSGVIDAAFCGYRNLVDLKLIPELAKAMKLDRVGRNTLLGELFGHTRF